VTPLTHHDILRLAGPLIERGWKIDPALGSREQRRIVCLPREPSLDARARPVMVLDAIDEDTIELTRAAAWPCPGAPAHPGVSTLCARAPLDQLDALVEVMSASPDEQRVATDKRALSVLDQVLLPHRAVGRGDSAAAALSTRAVRVLCPPLVLDVDASTSAATPADIRLWHMDAPASSVRDTLASGAVHPAVSPAARLAVQVMDRARRPAVQRPASVSESASRPSDELRAALHLLPDDLLAVQGVDWRILRWQGGHWKGALALPRRQRLTALDTAAEQARNALMDIVQDPHHWHARHRDRRRRVFVRRLKPLMMLGAILAVMPIAWLATSRGGVELHPLLLGIAPLLMVGMIAMSAREIPVMEWPPRLAAIPRPARDILSTRGDETPPAPATR